ncbi:MAG: ParB/RepB/Spo0J family partition protein [Bulleidia sp.]
MINTICDISEITFETRDCEKLLESIRTRGIAIPVQVNRTDSGYACVDGNRRLSACQILCKQDERFRRIPVMILNDYSRAGSAFWGNTQNRH